MKKRALYAVPLLLVAACGSTTAKSAVVTGPTTTTPPIERQQRTLACGTTIGAPLSNSLDSDPMQIKVTSAVAGDKGVALAYQITATDPKTMLSLPIGDVPPTGLLLKDGQIVATETPAKPSIDAGPAMGYPVGQKPYEKNLLVDQACPGMMFKDMLDHLGQYRVVVVMSVQNAGMPKDTKTPLVQAVGTLKTAG